MCIRDRENIGLIIIDEEQEHTYRSESAPRYSAHEVARQRAAENGALLLLASATPSTESFYAARNSRTQLVRLTQRYGGNPLPTVQIVDMRAELASGNPREISLAPVSYTHLDVYKRQIPARAAAPKIHTAPRMLSAMQ